MLDKKIKRAIKLLMDYEDDLKPRWAKPASDETIAEAEKLIGHKLPKDFKDYLKCFGQLTIEGTDEIYGIVDDNLKSGSELDFVTRTLDYRENHNMPDHLIAISGYTLGRRTEKCLNYQMLQKNGEPKVTNAYPDEESYEVDIYSSNSYGNFLVQTIKDKVPYPWTDEEVEESTVGREKEEKRRSFFSMD